MLLAKPGLKLFTAPGSGFAELQPEPWLVPSLIQAKPVSGPMSWNRDDRTTDHRRARRRTNDDDAGKFSGLLDASTSGRVSGLGASRGRRRVSGLFEAATSGGISGFVSSSDCSRVSGGVDPETSRRISGP